jgi:transcriptional regulator with XRE-family HTH domain
MLHAMDDVRVGRILRALRRRRGWTQKELGRRAKVSQQAISLVERGRGGRLSVETIRRVFAAIDARWEPTVSWRGGDLDRLLDAEHAMLVGEISRRLVGAGWDVAVEVTYSGFGERGSIDVLGARRDEFEMVVVEVKSELTAIEATLRKLDEKVRIVQGLLGGSVSGSGLGLSGVSSCCHRQTWRVAVWRRRQTCSTSHSPIAVTVSAAG